MKSSKEELFANAFDVVNKVIADTQAGNISDWEKGRLLASLARNLIFACSDLIRTKQPGFENHTNAEIIQFLQVLLNHYPPPTDKNLTPKHRVN